MIRHPIRTACLAVAVLLAASAPAALADVKDNANLFTAPAVSDANAKLARISSEFHKDLDIETYRDVPADLKGKQAGMDEHAFFHDWMAARAKARGTNGVFVLICDNPKYVDIGAGTETREKGIFTQQDLDSLREQIDGQLKAGQNDAALSGAVAMVDRTFTANVPGASRSGGGGGGTAMSSNESNDRRSSSSNNTPAPVIGSAGHGILGKFGCGTILCLGVGIVIVFALVRRLLGSRGPTGGGGFARGGFGGGGPTYPTGGPAYGGGGYVPPTTGGGGFGRGLLGGLLGGAVGGYAADKFEHRSDPSASAGGAPAGGDSGGGFGGSDAGGGGGGFDAGPSDAGQGFGGGDSGGGFGGGDAGGGGGGGDAGGGGGDSGGGF